MCTPCIEVIVICHLLNTPHRIELGWLFANHDFVDYFEKNFTSDFGHYEGYRYCVYEYNPDCVTHGCVRFTYKKTLLPHDPSEGKPEFKPWRYNSDGM